MMVEGDEFTGPKWHEQDLHLKPMKVMIKKVETRGIANRRWLWLITAIVVLTLINSITSATYLFWG